MHPWNGGVERYGCIVFVLLKWIQMKINSDNIIIIGKTDFSELVKRNIVYVNNFALSLTRNQADAHDLLQETLLRAYNKRNRYTEDRNFKGWLIAIMKNIFIDRYRRKLRVPILMDVNTAARSNNPGSQNDGEVKLAMDDIQKQIHLLDAKYRTPFLMYYSGYPYAEIAERNNIPLGTVKNRIFKARKILQHKLKEQEKPLIAA